MADEAKKNELWGRLGSKVKASGKTHKNDEVRGGFTELPPINSGVAKLARLEFVNDEGVMKFRAIGTVDSPMYGEGGVPVRGLETAQFASLNEIDYDKGVSDVFDVYRKLVGQESFDKLYSLYEKYDDYLERMGASILSANSKSPIYFRFSNKLEENKNGKMDPKTGKPFPPRTWQRWQWFIPGHTPLSTGSTPTPAPTPSTNGHANHVPTVSPTDPAPWSERQSTPESFPLTNPPSDAGAVEDWDQLVADANNDFDSAKDQLERAALELGYSKDDVTDATGWEEVGEWLKAGKRKDGGDDSTEAATIPAGCIVGNTVRFFPQDKKYPKDPTKRNTRAVNCEIKEIAGGKMKLYSLTDPVKVWELEVNSPYVEYPSKAVAK